MKSVALLSVFVVLSSVAAFGAVVVTPEQSECLPGPVPADGTMTVVVEGCALHFLHTSVAINCCLLYEPRVTIDGFQIVIEEVDNGPPCDCFCWHDLGVLITGLAEGLYTIAVAPFPGDDKMTFTMELPPCEDFVLMAPEVWAVVGTSGVEVPVYATNAKPLEGFSFGVTYPLRHARMADISLVGTVTEKVGAEFTALTIYNGEDILPPADDQGWATFAVILDAREPFDRQTIPAGKEQHIATLVYDLPIPTGGAMRSISVPFVDGLGKPPVPVLFVVGGQDVAPVTRHGIIQLTWPPAFIRGDANDNGSMTIADPIYLLNFLFAHGPVPPCEDAADANDDGTLNLADAIKILGYLFMQGTIPPPSPPGPAGIDPTLDTLDCART